VLRRAADREVEISMQETDRSLARLLGTERAEYRLRPDLVIRRTSGVTAVGDAKWKRLSVGRGGYLFPNEADLYQMHAYSTAYECQNVALIYPWHRGLASSRETSFEIPAPCGGVARITVVCIDVSSDSFTLARGAGAAEFGPLLHANRAVRAIRSIEER
jgi:5-methylcytosine-specific restriction enzyme subunit McrC